MAVATKRAAARALAQATGAKLNRIAQGANAVGLARHGVLPGGQGKHTAGMLDGSMKTVVLYGVDPQFDFANGTQALTALSGAKVVAFSAYASDALKKVAHVILPIGLLPEIEGSLTNVDGTTQTSRAGAKLPGDSRPGWRVLKALADKLAIGGFDFTDLGGLQAGLAPLAATSGTGLAAAQPSSAGLERIVSTPIYRGDAVLRRATALNHHPLTHGARAVLHPEEAIARGLADGAIAKVGDGVGSAALPVHVSPRVPRGAIWIESGYEATAPLSPTAGLAVVRAGA